MKKKELNAIKQKMNDSIRKVEGLKNYRIQTEEKFI